MPVTIPGEEGRAPEEWLWSLLSAPRAPLPGRGGALSRTWNPPGKRARHTPSPPTVPRPRGGQAGSAPSPLLHVEGAGPSARRGASGPRKLGNPQFKRYPRIRSTRRPPYGQGPSTPIRRLRAFPRRRRKTPTPKPPPAPGGVSGSHLHDAVRGFGCRHLHPRLPPPAAETPPLFSSALPPGPPYTGGSTARPPRPRQEISLVEEVTRLEIPFSHWAKETPIKAEVPAYSGVSNPALSTGMEKDCPFIARSATDDWAESTGVPAPPVQPQSFPADPALSGHLEIELSPKVPAS